MKNENINVAEVIKTIHENLKALREDSVDYKTLTDDEREILRKEFQECYDIALSIKKGLNQVEEGKIMTTEELKKKLKR